MIDYDMFDEDMSVEIRVNLGFGEIIRIPDPLPWKSDYDGMFIRIFYQ
jgi:hypothetical protein